MDSDAPDIMTLKQAAQYVRLEKKKLARLANAKKVPAKKIGGLWRFSRSALDEFFGGTVIGTHEP